MATIVIPEQIVFTVKPVGHYPADVPIEANWPEQLPTLLITFNGNKYTVKCTYFSEEEWYYGEEDDNGSPVFTTYPFYIVKDAQFGGLLRTEKPGEYIINAVVAEENPIPKVLSFPKGRTIVSELSRLNKAFGTISTKKTIIGQLSDLADAAEAGKIGGGSGEITYVHIDRNIVDDHDVFTADKSYDEISDIISNEIPVSVIDGSAIYPFADRTRYTIRFSRTRVNNGNMFAESYVFTSDGIQQDTQAYDVTPSSNSYT